MAGPLDWSLLGGVVPLALLGGAAVSGVLLLADRGRAWWRWKVPSAAALGVVAGILTGVIVDDWWHPFPDRLPVGVLVWVGLAVSAVALVPLRFAGLGWKGRVGACCGAVVVVLAASSQVNRHYQYYPTLRAALGPWIGSYTDFAKASGDRHGPLIVAPAGKMLADVWSPPAGLPVKGTVSQVRIPPTVSHFGARGAWVYLPPAYQASPRPQLPLLVLIAGQPGSPRDWIDSLGLKRIMDEYAAAHKGLAPVVVMPDVLGSQFANPLCLNSKLGDVQTYLTTDVPAWVRANLQVVPSERGWTIGGYSFGGTCSLQLAVQDPALYPSFLDMSGQSEPTLGSRSESVKATFGGNAAAFSAVNPLDVLKTKKFPQVAGVILVGASDGTYGPQQRQVFAACQQAGMKVSYVEVPGGHSFDTWRVGLARELPWIAEQNGLARP
ncbi:hypothetical protein KGQ20_22770 [Catenulispora sp. NF23]|uniref:alpha/beta hydrolase n=1 Tax=Catenulispora pinistramenti TaxID=2705254 RepID=UPI001BA88F51|nr:alpha/beta hydrolase-fold protein [Catenulispora pinistramenti]MBS2535589.1 hypothetical protein [Catenulispora pinistramenti]